MNPITHEELNQLVDEGGVVLLEALPPMYFEAGHLPGARNMPLDDIESLAPVLLPDKTAVVVTYCTGLTCTNSKIAAARLAALGYTNVRAYEGGKDAWIGAGRPMESSATEGG